MSVPQIGWDEFAFTAYKHQLVAMYGPLVAYMVKDVEEGRKTAKEFFEVMARAQADCPCPECGRGP